MPGFFVRIDSGHARFLKKLHYICRNYQKINMKKYLIILFSLLAVFTFTSCSDDEKDDEKDSVTEVNIYVSDETEIMYDLFDTEGTNPIECMLVKEGDAGDWQKLPFGFIEGFTYEKGHSYTLRVSKTIFANPPQDTWNFTYKMKSILKDEVISEPNVPAVDIKSEADIEYEERCPFVKYAVDSPVLIDKDGKIYTSNGRERPSFENCRIYLNNALEKDDPNWILFNRVQYMAQYAYVFSPLSDKVSLVSVSGDGPLLEYIISESEFDNIVAKSAVGEELKFVVVLVNVNRKGLQRLELVIKRC